MDRVDWYFRQLVTEAELDGAFDDVETAFFNLALDWEFFGIFGSGSPMVVTEFSGTPNLTVDVTAGTAYDQLGQRVRIPSTQNLDVSVDSLSVTTSVGTPGNEKIVSVHAKFDRALSDPRTDGNSNTVFFERDETFQFVVTQGSETASPPATPPPLEADAVLLADIRRTNPQTQIFDADITPPGGTYTAISNRRQDAFVEIGGAQSIRQNTVNGAFQEVIQDLNDHVTDVGAAHDASAIGATIAATWADASGIVGTDVDAVLEEIVNDLAATAGSARVGAAAIAGSPTSFTAGDVDSILGEALAAINARARLASTETVSGDWTFSGSNTFSDTIRSEPGATDDANIIDDRTAGSNVTLLFDMPYLGGTRKLRIFGAGSNLFSTGGLLITLNMAYDGAGDDFVLDDTAAQGLALTVKNDISAIVLQSFATGAGVKNLLTDAVTTSAFPLFTTSDMIPQLGGVWQNDDQIASYCAHGYVAAAGSDIHAGGIAYPKQFPVAPSGISGLTNHILTNTSSPIVSDIRADGLALQSTSTAAGLAFFSSSFDVS